MESRKVPSRRSIKIKINKDLAKVLKEEYSICCAWGFQYGQLDEPLYNIVGWSADEIQPIMTIHWSETYRVTASGTGCVPKFFVDSATEPLQINPGETFVFDTFDRVSISPDQPPEDPQDAFAFTTKTPGCSIVLERGLDLQRENDEDNFTPMFIASNGAQTFPVPTAGYIRPTDKILIWFQPISKPLIRRQAFDRKSLAMEPLEYQYGTQSTKFTQITLDFVDGRPQLLNTIIAFPTESRMLMPISRRRPSA
ncbi:hypothetical protein K491DRAFT_692095 [Lophiostoma macrostomum CBS 122681]|uniref:Uncharacterized protein n=1 Tax=Lophiostoma macrostomum CBS 122681 TaxID=1314788 RepID=A0A6A6TBW5_9PLEO|nr:hypothetical protein K491DRAFT_692095 [Lophiostoma macrostomum CBS 122681]